MEPNIIFEDMRVIKRDLKRKDNSMAWFLVIVALLIIGAYFNVVN